MAADRNRCCGHEHYEPDEVWLSLDELIEVVRMTVQQCLALPDQRLPADERDQIKARIRTGRAAGDDEHQAAAAPGRPWQAAYRRRT